MNTFDDKDIEQKAIQFVKENAKDFQIKFADPNVRTPCLTQSEMRLF
jgi:hypothetical protein